MAALPKMTTILFKSANKKQSSSFHSNTKLESVALYITETFHMNNFLMYFNNNPIANYQKTLSQVIGKAKGIIYVIPKDGDSYQQRMLETELYDERLKTMNDDNIGAVMNTCGNANGINMTEGNLITYANVNTVPNKQINKHFVEAFKEINELRAENSMIQSKINELEQQDEGIKDIVNKNMRRIEPNNREITVMKKQIDEVNQARLDIEKELKFVNMKLERHLKNHQKRIERNTSLKTVNKKMTFLHVNPNANTNPNPNAYVNANDKEPITALDTIELIEKYHEGKIRRDVLIGSLDYLDIESLFTLSLINKDTCYITMDYLDSMISYTQYESTNKMLNVKKAYTEAIKSIPFILSSESIASLKEMCSSTFIKDNKQMFIIQNAKVFSYKAIVIVYRILFQLTNEIQSSSYGPDEDFILHMFDFIQRKINQEYPFGEYMSNAVIAFDLSFPNYLRIIDIITSYPSLSTPINLPLISTHCKTTPFIALIIQDILRYFGIDCHNKLYDLYLNYQSERNYNDNYKKMQLLLRKRLSEL